MVRVIEKLRYYEVCPGINLGFQSVNLNIFINETVRITVGIPFRGGVVSDG